MEHLAALEAHVARARGGHRRHRGRAPGGSPLRGHHLRDGGRARGARGHGAPGHRPGHLAVDGEGTAALLRGEGDGGAVAHRDHLALLVGAEDARAHGAEPLEGLVGGVAVVVARAAGDDGRLGLHRREEGRCRRVAASVVRHFQHRGGEVDGLLEQVLLGLRLGVAHEEEGRLAVRQLGHHGVGVHVRARVREERVLRHARREDGERHALAQADGEQRLGGARVGRGRHHLAHLLAHHVQQLAVGLARVVEARVHVAPGPHRLNHLREAAQVVQVRVREDDQVQRSLHQLAHARYQRVIGLGRAAVDEDRLARGRDDERRVALAHVEEVDGERLERGGLGGGGRGGPARQGGEQDEEGEEEPHEGHKVASLPCGGRHKAPARTPGLALFSGLCLSQRRCAWMLGIRAKPTLRCYSRFRTNALRTYPLARKQSASSRIHKMEGERPATTLWGGVHAEESLRTASTLVAPSAGGRPIWPYPLTIRQPNFNVGS